MVYYGTILLFIVNFIFSIMVIFVERKHPYEALIWLLLFTLLPVVGFILYLFIGSTLSFRIDSQLAHKHETDAKLEPLLPMTYRAMPSGHGKDPLVTGEYLELATMLKNMGRAEYTHGNDAELLIDGAAFFPRLLEDIASAKESIHIEFFIIAAREQTAKTVIEALAVKARQGVEVRLIYDACGDLTCRPRHYKVLREAGGIIYRHLPSMLASLFNANYLNHRKIVVIDGRIGYTGGINIGDSYIGLHKKVRPWRDTMARVTGPAVADMQTRFIKDWNFLEKRMRIKNPIHLSEKYYPRLEPTGTIGMQMVSSGPDTPNEPIKNGMITMIYAAKDSIAIQSPYLIPDTSFVEALKNAAASGLRVDVMIPGIADKSYVYYATCSNIEELLEAGVHIHMYHGFLHAKMMVVDKKICTLGTTNVDIRSFRLDFEFNAFMYGEAFSKSCQDRFDCDLASCDEVELEAFRHRGGKKRVLESICRLFSPIM